MSKNERLAICFTGHRPKYLVGYNKEKYTDFIDDLKLKLKNICDKANKPVTFISGGAQGFDQLSFWAVDSLKKDNSLMDIKNIVYVPFRGQQSIWPKDTLFGQNDYDTMLQCADTVVYLNETIPQTDKGRISASLLSRNHRMVDDSDYVIALCSDNDWQKKSGGTAECMRYAHRTHKDILQLKYIITNTGKLAIDSMEVIRGS